MDKKVPFLKVSGLKTENIDPLKKSMNYIKKIESNNVYYILMVLNTNQIKLLNNLLLDQKKVDKKLYSAGPYWDYKTKKILYWLKKKGLENFRGLDSGVGTGFTDNTIKDIRYEVGFKGRLVSCLTYLPFLKKIFDEQIRITSSHIQTLIKFQQAYYENNEKVNYLISKYKINNSTNFGCTSKFKFKKKEYSILYLDMCERIDNINKFLNLSEIKSFLEIGGGFGSNIHLLINNFKNIKKIIYVDIVPNLFIGTEYLRSLFNNAVKDYNSIRNENEIEFEKNDHLEIICIPPWKINNIVSKVDSFHNSASFQEMTEIQVQNYKNLIKKILNKNSISLIVYKGWEKNNSLSPNIINNIFENKLTEREFTVLDQREIKLVYLTYS